MKIYEKKSKLHPDDQDLISRIKNKLDRSDIGDSKSKSGTQRASRYTYDGSRIRFNSNSVSFSSHTRNGLSAIKVDENNFTIARPGLPKNIARIFVDNDLVSSVFATGQLMMKPMSCLSEAEKNLIDDLKKEINDVENLIARYRRGVLSKIKTSHLIVIGKFSTKLTRNSIDSIYKLTWILCVNKNRKLNWSALNSWHCIRKASQSPIN